MTTDNRKKVLQVRKGEYLLDILMQGGIRTTYNETQAMDIGEWSFDQFAYIINNLKKVGYKQAVAKWIDLPEVVEDEVVEETVEEEVESDEV